jgi:hypothetical protein
VNGCTSPSGSGVAAPKDIPSAPLYQWLIIVAVRH